MPRTSCVYADHVNAIAQNSCKNISHSRIYLIRFLAQLPRANSLTPIPQRNMYNSAAADEKKNKNKYANKRSFEIKTSNVTNHLEETPGRMAFGCSRVLERSLL